MNSESIFINNDFIEEIKSKCGLIDDSALRCKTAAGIFISNIAGRFFDNDELDCNSGIHSIPEVVSDIEVSDVYLQDSYIDVRFYFKENEICVPAELFKRNLLPVAFMFIKISEDLSGAQVAGFATPGEINTENEKDGYYPVDESSLLSYYDIEPLLTYSDDNALEAEDNILVYDYLDNKLEDKDSFYRKLFESKELRLALKNAAVAKYKFTALKNVEIKEPATPAVTVPDITETVSDDTASDITDLEEQLDSENINLDLTDTDTDLSEFEISDENVEELSFDTTADELEEFSDTADDLGIDIPHRKDEDEDSAENENNTEESLNFDFANDTVEPENIDFDTQNEEQSAEGFDLESSDEAQNLDDLSFDNTDEIQSHDETNFDITDENNDTASDDIEIDTPAAEYYETVSNEDTADNVSESGNYEITDENADESTAEAPQDDIEPALNFADEDNETIDIVEDLPEEESDNDEQSSDDNSDVIYSTETTPSLAEQEEDIDNLFSESDENVSENIEADTKSKKKSPILPALGLFIIVAGLGYFGYTKLNPSELPQDSPVSEVETTTSEEKAEDTMPVETVENIAKDNSSNEGTAVSIPAIENNLDASVLVSNLSVSWEVPAAYTNNNSARRYFAKIGKIIQMNLKAELLLLSKPPINNKVVVEIEYNKTSGNYSVKGITVSSGEKVIDDAITNSVKNVLNMNLNIDTSSFGTISGNPMLIIKL